MDFYGGGRDPRYGGGIATPGYAPPVPYGMSQVNIEGKGCGRPLPPQPTVKVYCRADPNYALTIRNGRVVLAPANPKDEYQHWIKDMRWSTSVKDEEGYPAFALVNKATGEAVKHSLGQSHPVRLVPYNPDVLDESVLWTESRDVGNGFRCVRIRILKSHPALLLSPHATGVRVEQRGLRASARHFAKKTLNSL